ncbi:hypothetical protein GCM10025776_31170 [Corallincola platygyrae]|uniref:putative bifunctional diguanylate cyclase/phosphodiesterase n=1 Tax=Corallincola platygyrae TaxID=1193278 RepID=UPI0031EB1925
MKLINRVNFILVPIILGVLSFASVLAYLFFANHSAKVLASSVTRELHFFAEEIEQTLQRNRATANEILNSAELVRFLNSANPQFQAYAFEIRMRKLLASARQNSQQIEQVQLLDQDLNILIANSDNDDPFSDPVLLPFPDYVFNRYQYQRNSNDDDLTAQQFIYMDAQSKLRFGLLQPFSPKLLLEDLSRIPKQKHNLLLLGGAVNKLSALREKLMESYQLSPDEIKINWTSQVKDTKASTPLVSSGRGPYGQYLFQLRTSQFKLALTLPYKANAPLMGNLTLVLTGLVLTMTLVSFVVLRGLINKQVIKPINSLIEQIQASRAENNISLEHKDSSDEVSELNNAYIELLDDVQHLATNDTLTGLANRYSFQLWLERQLQRFEKTQQPMALLFIDLDNFKQVNDHYGHEVGDKLLKVFSERLITSIRPTDLAASMHTKALARLAGDEFAVLLSSVQGPQSAATVAQRILEMFEGGIEVEGTIHNVQASIGIAMVPQDGLHAQQLLKHADAAMYRAKSLGKNRYQFFTKAIALELAQKQQIEQSLSLALEEDGFELVFMPIYDIDSLQAVGAEALIRCPRLAKIGIYPDQFIPVAESTGLIKQIDLWVMERALQNLNEVRDDPAFTGYYLSINVSAVELHNKHYPEQVRRLLEKYQIDTSLVELELTETSLSNDDESSLTTLNNLKSMGLTLSLDDFGTGYTAFNQLAAYPVDSLKIDRSFTNQVGEKKTKKQPMVDIILSLAELYKLRVVAEGVETKAQLNYLRDKGCNRAQGYYLCKPVPWQELTKKLSVA